MPASSSTDSAETSPEELRQLVRSLHLAQEAERTRVAQILHDDLLQTLAALKLGLGPLGSHGEYPSAALWATAAERSARLTDRAMAATRQLMAELRPPMLLDLGLGATLEMTLQQFSAQTGVRTQVQVLGPDAADRELAPAVATCLFRVVQAVLERAHQWIDAVAEGPEIHLCLDLAAPGTVGLGISVRGAAIGGPDPTAARDAELLGVAERLRAHGGHMEIRWPMAGEVSFSTRLRRDADSSAESAGSLD